jgi:hypothetical protein
LALDAEQLGLNAAVGGYRLLVLGAHDPWSLQPPDFFDPLLEPASDRNDLRACLAHYFA